MENLNIRLASPNDFFSIKSLMLKALEEDPLAFTVYVDEYSNASDFWWRNYLDAYFLPHKGAMYLAEVDGKIVGMVGLLFKNGRRVRHTATLVWFYVDHDFRGNKIGVKLMEEVLNYAEKITYLKKITLYVIETQTLAKEMYLKLGFEINGTHKDEIMYKDKYYDSIVMEKLL